MSVSLDRGATIGRLRLRATTADPNALRMRGASVVGALDLQPPAMPEQAVLCIRTLRDPMPGGLDLRFSAAPRPVAWEAAMRGAVGEALRRAARPALGPVPTNADAVLFADRAELLACAVRDALRGTLAGHWWWTHLLGGERSPAAVVREWTRAPAYVPAAVELLAAQGEIAAFARAIAPAEAVRLLEAVLRVHALPALASDVVHALTTRLVLPPAPPMPESRDVSPPEARPSAEPLAAPPWRAVVPDYVLTELTVEQQSFVAIALALRRAPALVRSERFASQIAVWIESEVSEKSDELRQGRSESARAVRPGDGRPKFPSEPGRVDRTVRHDDFLSPLRGSDGWESTVSPGLTARADSDRPGGLIFQTLSQRSEEAFLASGGGGPERSDTGATHPGLPTPFGGQIEPSLHRPDPPRDEAGSAPGIVERSADLEAMASPPRPDLAIDSDFAGVFFLLNVGIALGLYSDFTSPVQCGISLDIWDFLALTGPMLAEIADFGDDPIGPFLATLANRKEGEPPGAGFVPPSRGRRQSLREWLAATVARIRERLALAGIEDPSRVVRRHGRATTTPAHLDVYFSLAAHPIEIRLAGLDRDPGWIPAAGRHVAFHFD